MKYEVYSKEHTHGETIIFEQALVGLVLTYTLAGNIIVSGLIPDYSGQII